MIPHRLTWQREALGGVGANNHNPDLPSEFAAAARGLAHREPPQVITEGWQWRGRTARLGGKVAPGIFCVRGSS